MIVTGGLRVPIDFVKALALGADGIAVSNSAMQAIGCVVARMCNTNNCPAGIAAQKEELRMKLNIENAANQLNNFLTASIELMAVMARACGHDAFNKFNKADLATWHREIASFQVLNTLASKFNKKCMTWHCICPREVTANKATEILPARCANSY